MNQTELTFDGPRDTIDAGRLTRIFDKVFLLMSDGVWRTLREIAGLTGGSEAGVSARLRDCRKERFGGHMVTRRRRYGGTWEYQLTPRCL